MNKQIRINKWFFDVEYHCEGDEGIHTLPNGDPGYDSTKTMVVDSITTEDNLLELLSYYSSLEELLDSVKNSLYDQCRC